MNLKTLLESIIDPNPASVCLVAMATDGLEPTSNILQLVCRKGELADRLFIEGGDPIITYQFTRIPSDLYRYSADSCKNAWSKFAAVAGVSGSVVGGYNMLTFGNSILENFRVKAEGKEVYQTLDIMLLARSVRQKNCSGIKKPRSLQDLHDQLMRRPYNRSIRSSLSSMCEWLGLKSKDPTQLTADYNLEMLAKLYEVILELPID